MPAMPLPPAMHSRCLPTLGMEGRVAERAEQLDLRALDARSPKSHSETPPPGFFFTTNCSDFGLRS